MDFPIDRDTKSGLRIAFSDEEEVMPFVQWLSENNIKNSQILISDKVADRINSSFPMNSKYQSLIDQQSLQTRTRSSETIPTILLTDNEVHLEFEFAESKHMTNTDDEEAYSKLVTEFDRIFETSDSITIDVPAWDYLLEQLEELVGKATKEEYHRLISAASNDGQSLDEVSVALIAAALSGALNYDIAKWGEDMNVASKATFSRRKKELESEGIIETEKVPVDVGRPRQRLQLNDRVGSFDLDIGIEGEEIGVSESQTTDSSGSDKEISGSTKTNNNRTSQKVEEDTAGKSVDDIIEELDEELKRAISDED